ncbi:MAG TPA: 2-oxo acid dehydrogenase subunit E2, partial [Steroidobacteraceae bacterium]|nr:2-oxo acid dehydrogenase subunit E2 [Steroidobacteraceae bacterium]
AALPTTAATAAAPPAAPAKPPQLAAATAAAAASPIGGPIAVPDLGNFKDVEIIELLIKQGDRVEVDTPLLTLETEKATMDVPSPAAGVIDKLLVKKGDRVSAGTAIAVLAGATAATPPPAAPPAAAAVPPAPTAPARAAAPAAPASVAPTSEAGFATAHASPSVRQFARELGVDLGRVRGTGPKNRVLQDDVKNYVKAQLQAKPSGAAQTGTGLPRVPVVDFAQFGAVTIQPLNRIQRISGPRLHASWVNLPHVTQFDEADITELEDARRWLKARAAAEGLKLTPLAFVIRACVKLLKKFPTFNASLDPSGENLVLKQYCHIGFAADTPNGLMVPVIRDADRKDLFEIARALGDLSDKARKGKLSGAEMQGGCFTITSLGGIGGTAFTPIINAPEVAILGLSKSILRPAYREAVLVPRLMLPLSLSYDHRVIDGAQGARFTAALCAELANVDGLVEAIK